VLDGKKLLIFDCDGVLFNSRNANIAYFNKCLEIAGYSPLAPGDEEKTVYMSVQQMLGELFSDPDEIERLFRISQNLKYDQFLPYLNPIFNFNKVFSSLRKKYFLAMASNRAKSLTRIFLHFGLFEHFQFKISALEANPKPDPEMLLKCIDYFDLKKEECVYIGDSDSDMQAAANAGIDFIRVAEGEGDAVIASVEELAT